MVKSRPNQHSFLTIQLLTSVHAGTYSENKTNKQNISTIFYRLSQNNDIQDNAISTLTSDLFSKITNPNIVPRICPKKCFKELDIWISTAPSTGSRWDFQDFSGGWSHQFQNHHSNTVSPKGVWSWNY